MTSATRFSASAGFAQKTGNAISAANAKTIRLALEFMCIPVLRGLPTPQRHRAKATPLGLVTHAVFGFERTINSAVAHVSTLPSLVTIFFATLLTSFCAC
jgi:hypothetical protein